MWASESDACCAAVDSMFYMQVRPRQAIIPSKGSWDCYIEQIQKLQQGKSLHPWKGAMIGMAWRETILKVQLTWLRSYKVRCILQKKGFTIQMPFLTVQELHQGSHITFRRTDGEIGNCLIALWPDGMEAKHLVLRSFISGLLSGYLVRIQALDFHRNK